MTDHTKFMCVLSANNAILEVVLFSIQSLFSYFSSLLCWLARISWCSFFVEYVERFNIVMQGKWSCSQSLAKPDKYFISTTQCNLLKARWPYTTTRPSGSHQKKLTILPYKICTCMHKKVFILLGIMHLIISKLYIFFLWWMYTDVADDDTPLSRIFLLVCCMHSASFLFCWDRPITRERKKR